MYTVPLFGLCDICHGPTYGEDCSCQTHVGGEHELLIATLRHVNTFLDSLLWGTPCDVHCEDDDEVFRLTGGRDVQMDPITGDVLVPCTVLGGKSVACCVLAFKRRMDTGMISSVDIVRGETRTFAPCFETPVPVSKALAGEQLLYKKKTV